MAIDKVACLLDSLHASVDFHHVYTIFVDQGLYYTWQAMQHDVQWDDRDEDEHVAMHSLRWYRVPRWKSLRRSPQTCIMPQD